MIQTLKNKRSLMAINALLAVAVGLILLLVPQATLGKVGFIAGLLILVAGGFLVLGTFIYSEGQKTHPVWLVEGVINIALGAILMLKPVWLFEFLLMVSGIWAFVVGLVLFYVAFSAKKDGLRYNGLLIIGGLLAMATGVFLFVKPDLVSELILQILGGIALLLGVLMLLFAMDLHKLYKGAKKAAKLAAEQEAAAKLAAEKVAAEQAAQEAATQLSETKETTGEKVEKKKSFFSFKRKQ